LKKKMDETPVLPPRDPHDAEAWEDTKYFEEYGKYAIHCDMLRDKARMSSYYSAIMNNKEYFKDKVVLDVGCGTGVLACWCAKAGAKKVYAVEASSVAEQAELIIARNHLSSIITVHRCKIEDISLPEKVDLIISEWMGSFLLFESMLDSVLYARDHFLKSDGHMFPSYARLYLQPICMRRYLDKRLLFLHSVDGLDMSPLMPFAKQELSAWVTRGHKVKAEHLLGDKPNIIREFIIKNITVNDIKKFSASIKFTINSNNKNDNKNDNNNNNNNKMHGFVAWFEVEFPILHNNNNKNNTNNNSVILSTAPDKLLTHWRHDIFFLREELPLKEKSEIEGIVIFQQNNWWKRHYDVEFSFNVDGREVHAKLSS